MGLLTQKEIEQLTGTKTKHVQKRVLDNNGIFYVEGAKGSLAVTWHAVEHPYHLAGSNAANEDNRDTKPNFGAIS